MNWVKRCFMPVEKCYIESGFDQNYQYISERALNDANVLVPIRWRLEIIDDDVEPNFDSLKISATNGKPNSRVLSTMVSHLVDNSNELFDLIVRDLDPEREMQVRIGSVSLHHQYNFAADQMEYAMMMIWGVRYSV